MASIAWSDVVALAPELTAVSAGAQTAILAFVNDSDTFKADDWRGEDGSMLHLGRSYLAAHMGAISVQGGGGPVTAESAGGLSRSYGIGNFGPSGYTTTVYGIMYLQLVRSAAGGPMVI